MLCLPGQCVDLQLQRVPGALTGTHGVTDVTGLVVGDDRGAIDLAHGVIATADAGIPDADREGLLHGHDSLAGLRGGPLQEAPQRDLPSREARDLMLS